MNKDEIIELLNEISVEYRSLKDRYDSLTIGCTGNNDMCTNLIYHAICKIDQHGVRE